MSTHYLVIKNEPARTDEGELLDCFHFLGQRGGVQGLRPWTDSIEDSRVEFFASKYSAEQASASYGGVLIDASRFEEHGLDQSWQRLEPSSTATLDGISL